MITNKLFSKAVVLYEQCLSKRKEVLGENHPSTLDTMSNLALTYDHHHHQGSV